MKKGSVMRFALSERAKRANEAVMHKQSAELANAQAQAYTAQFALRRLFDGTPIGAAEFAQLEEAARKPLLVAQRLVAEIERDVLSEVMAIIRRVEGGEEMPLPLPSKTNMAIRALYRKRMLGRWKRVAVPYTYYTDSPPYLNALGYDELMKGIDADEGDDAKAAGSAQP